MSSYSTLIVTFNNEGWIGDCISSLKKYGPENNQIIVVDNASQDGTLVEIEACLPLGITLIKNRKNFGLGYATCQAYEKATGDMILFSNPDIIYTEKSRLLFDYAESHPETGMFQPPLKNDPKGGYGGKNIDYQKAPFWMGTYFGYFLNKRLGNFLQNYYLRYRGLRPKKRMVVTQRGEKDTQVYGASCMLFARWFVESIGGIFTPKYFWVFSDSDMSERISRAGLSGASVPKSEVKHFGGHSTSREKILNNQQLAWRHYLTGYCWGTYEKDWKHWGRNGLIFLADTVFLTIGEVGTNLLPSIRRRKPTRGALRSMKLKVMQRIFFLMGWFRAY